jgi:hypothetical protein
VKRPGAAGDRRCRRGPAGEGRSSGAVDLNQERITSEKWGLGYFVEFWPWPSADVDLHPTALSELDWRTGLLDAIHVFLHPTIFFTYLFFFCLYIG